MKIETSKTYRFLLNCFEILEFKLLISYIRFQILKIKQIDARIRVEIRKYWQANSN